jgi:hypothetical protein
MQVSAVASKDGLFDHCPLLGEPGMSGKPASILVALVASLPFFSRPADGQKYRFDLEPGTELSGTLGLGGVAHELQMTADQQFELSDLPVMTELRMQELLRNYHAELGATVPAEMQTALLEQLVADRAKIRAWEQEQLEKVLSPEQLERLRQLRIQHVARSGGGFVALQELLGLSDQQLAQIRQIGEDRRRDMGDHERTCLEAGIPRADIDHDLRHMRAKAQEQVLAVLDASQRRELETLQGQPFSFDDPPRTVDAEDAEGGATNRGTRDDEDRGDSGNDGNNGQTLRQRD